MDRLYDNINTSGNLEVWKIYNDGEEELVFCDHNTIVSGMGSGLMALFGGIHSNDIRDFQIRYYQLGTGVNDPVTTSLTKLSAPLTSEDYDPSGVTTLTISAVNVFENNTASTEQDAILIPWNHIKKVTPTSVLYTLVLDSQAANGITLKEVGLFIKSPFNVGGKLTPVLAAYKTYSPIDKKQEFSLVFKWTIYF
jgi:hypothetical protein